MPYLEIYPMENCASKISNQLDKVIETRPTMYNKTRDRYKRLAYSLLQSVEKISTILEEDSLIPYNVDEFDELLQTSNNIQEIASALETTQQRVSSCQDFVSSNVGMSNKDIVAKFASILESASSYDFGYEEVNQCAGLLHKWFQTRFTPVVKNPNFKYSISQLPTWIYNIILIYGKSYKYHQLPALINMFDNWCEDILEDTSIRWAIPYEVFELKQKPDPRNFTLEAVVISDLLMSDAYYELCEYQMMDSSVYLEATYIPSVVKSNNSELVPKIRTRLAKQSELIEECNLTLTGGGNMGE